MGFLYPFFCVWVSFEPRERGERENKRTKGYPIPVTMATKCWFDPVHSRKINTSLGGNVDKIFHFCMIGLTPAYSTACMAGEKKGALPNLPMGEL